MSDDSVRGACIVLLPIFHDDASRALCNSCIQQVGLMLRGMGFDNSTFIYLASGKIYDAERNMAPLLEMFPNLLTKEMLASPEELSPFKVEF